MRKPETDNTQQQQSSDNYSADNQQPASQSEQTDPLIQLLNTISNNPQAASAMATALKRARQRQ